MRFRFLILFLFPISLSVYGSSDKCLLFEVNYHQIEKELNSLNELETYVNTHKGITLSEMQAENHVLSMNISNLPAITIATGEYMSKVPAFLFGLCLGPIGVVMVLYIFNDNDDVLMSVLGCTVLTFLYGVGYFLFK